LRIFDGSHEEDHSRESGALGLPEIINLK